MNKYEVGKTPKGWRRLRKHEIVRKGDKSWHPLQEKPKWMAASICGSEAACYYAVIRRKAKRPSAKGTRGMTGVEA